MRKTTKAIGSGSGANESYRQDYQSMNGQGVEQNTAAFEPDAAQQEPQSTVDAQAWQAAQSTDSAGQSAYGGSYYTNGDTTYHNNAYTANQQPKQPKPPRKKGRGGKLALKIVACVLACLVVSGASIGGVIALANAGYISIGGTSSSMDINGKVNSSADESDRRVPPAAAILSTAPPTPRPRV